MPEPDWAAMDYDPLEPPHLGTEILGRGPKSRKSKTFIPDISLATHLGLIPTVGHDLLEIQRRLHAAHHKVTITTETREGDIVTQEVPEVLTDEEVLRKYPAFRAYPDAHQEWVEHFNSIKGFGVVRATDGADDAPRQRREDSSAGADRRREDNSKPRWE